MKSLNLFKVGARGVNSVTAPTHLQEDELISAQNAEPSPITGEGAIDQRPGMSKVNSSALNSGATIAAITDNPSVDLINRTRYLYAAQDAAASHNWRRSSDGTTWSNDDTPVKTAGWNTIPGSLGDHGKPFNPKTITLNGKLYYTDGLSPIGIYQYDGVTNIKLGTIPPAVSGTLLSTPSAPAVTDNGGSVGTATYKVVARAGSAYSAASAGTSVAHDSNNYITPVSPPVAGATSYDLYRTAGGGSQGKIGNIPIVGGVFTTGNGSPGVAGVVYADTTDPGDASVAPAAPSGTATGDALWVFDIKTDGYLIYLAVLDYFGADPTTYGRILAFSPSAGTWTQIGAGFPIASGNGTPSVLLNFDGSISYGTFCGKTAGNTNYETTTGYPLAVGGIPEVHTNAVSQVPLCMAVFNNDVYVGVMTLAGGTAAKILKRTELATWSTAVTAGGTLNGSGYTSMAVFNGKLFAGWNSNGATSLIISTSDGINWATDFTLGNEIIGQMVSLNDYLYAVLPTSGGGRVVRRDTAGNWTAVDNASGGYSGALGVLYV